MKRFVRRGFAGAATVLLMVAGVCCLLGCPPSVEPEPTPIEWTKFETTRVIRNYSDIFNPILEISITITNDQKQDVMDAIGNYMKPRIAKFNDMLAEDNSFLRQVPLKGLTDGYGDYAKDANYDLKTVVQKQRSELNKYIAYINECFVSKDTEIDHAKGQRGLAFSACLDVLAMNSYYNNLGSTKQSNNSYFLADMCTAADDFNQAYVLDKYGDRIKIEVEDIVNGGMIYTIRQSLQALNQELANEVDGNATLMNMAVDLMLCNEALYGVLDNMNSKSHSLKSFRSGISTQMRDVKISFPQSQDLGL